MNIPYHSDTRHFKRNLLQLYWAMRIGIAFLWIGTTVVSWFFYPHAESLAWLRQLGVTYQASLVFPTRRLWQ